MPRWTRHHRLMAIVAATWLAAGCAASGPPSATSPIASSGPPSAASPIAATTAAGTDDPGSPPASAPAIAASTTPAGSFDPAQPPPASLAVEGGDPVVGQLGSLTWGDGGSDSPWLPGAPIEVASGERLTVDVAGGPAVATWSARRVAGTARGSAGPVGLGSGPGPAAFDAPPVGVWSVAVTLDFAGELGSATYYWAITVR